MVNRGRPSRDCLPCRKRKLRCDLQAGVCGQCRRAKLRCYGYRNAEDLVFRDETDATEQKVLARRPLPYPAKPAVAPILQWDVRARQAFFSLYVGGLTHNCASLIPLYAQASTVGHLTSSVDALSLALAAFQFDSGELMRLANERYVTAIQRLGRVLCNPHASASDETLQSVLLLDLYEKITNRDLRRLSSWMSHIQGAMTLVGARGNKNYSSPMACQLASRVAVTLTISCGAATLPVPDGLMVLRRDLDGLILDAKWYFTAMLVDVVNLRADVRSDRLASRAEVAERASELGRRLATLEEKLPQSWQPKSVLTVGQDPRVFGRCYDIYPSHFITQVWNAIRTMRLEMNSMVRNHDCDSDTSASEAITCISRRICDTIPQFILPGAWPGNGEPFSPLQKLQCGTLLMPLYLAAQLSTDVHMRDWIIHSIDYIAEMGNMKIARDVSAILRSTPNVDYWIVYAMTGSYAVAA
ncbi:hypothetical protein B0J11DRAFT_199548 [Dendryphion nanum]|uniref:Zn(2)-C6 fungal-type domain-containing protein n=1 Tax=Dendryphion nanum TaxID=256645 RepID=A0A9P9D0I3_9PLEO|nr:hypothetical protein B0J11DRAFT_199548 [Dendryphion nanum]